jgi:hypothetical protein
MWSAAPEATMLNHPRWRSNAVGHVTLRVSSVSKLHLDDELWPPEREVLDNVVEVTCRRSLTVLVP